MMGSTYRTLISGQPVENGQFLPMPTIDKAYIQYLQEAALRYGQQVFAPDFLE